MVVNLFSIKDGLSGTLLRYHLHLPNSNDFISKNYTLITSKSDEPLAQFVNENIDHYISIILDNCDKCITDEESAALAIINNTEIDVDKKEEYISCLQTVIENLEDVITKDLWSLLLQQKRAQYSKENILSYFFLSEKDLDYFLIQFINENSDNLDFDTNSINSKFGENATIKFSNAIVTCNELSNERYNDILQALNYYYESFSTIGIADEKVLILIKLNIIRMVAPVLLFMRDHYPDQLLPFITKNIAQYTNEVIDEENFALEEILAILDENVVDEYKIDLLRYATDEISVHQKKYSDAVKLHILEHNLDVNDIPFLLTSFQHESDGLKKVIKQISVEHITEIITQEYSIPFELLSELLAAKQLTMETKKDLFVLCLPNMNEARAKEYLRTLQMGDFLSLFCRKRPKFEINSINKQILAIFQKEKWITKFDIDKDEPNYYRAYGRKRQK